MSATMLFNNLITFSRGSNATLTGPTGLIQWAPMNLLTYSEQFDNAAWTKSNATVTANSTTAPDGSATADKLVEDAANSTHYASGSATTTAATHAFSCYIKAAERSFVLLWNSTANFGRVFDLGSGTVSGTVAGVTQATADIANVGNGWYRCTIYGTCTAASNSFRAYTMTDATTFTYTGTAGSGIYVWGAQLELGTTATTYNSTTTKNLLGYSEAFDNAAWQKSNASIVAGAAANPVNGLFNAQKLMEDTANALHRMVGSTTLNVSAGGRYVLSVYAKASGARYLYVNYTATLNAASTFDLQTGTISATGGGTGSITAVGNGWYRCSVTGTAPATALATFYLQLNDTGVASDRTYTGDGNSGVYIYGAQLSDSGSLDPYVPTPGAAPTSAAYYGPRFDYDPVTLAAKGLLIEEARTNLLTYSEQFDNAAWVKAAITVTANATTSPDGTTNADKVVEDTTTSAHNVYRSVAGLTGAHTYTFYAKAGERSWLYVEPAGSSVTRTYFNLSGAGSIGTLGAGVTATIRETGNGWYRVSWTYTFAAATAWLTIGLATANGTNSYTGDGTSGIYIWGAQLEAGAFATSYIPTVASTVTRSADVATLTGSNFAPWYNQNAGTFVSQYSQFSSSASQIKAVAIASDGSANNVVYIYVGTTGLPNGLVSVGGVTEANPSNSAISSNTAVKTAFAYKVNDFALVTGGGAAATDASGAVPTVNRLGIGANSTGLSSYLNGHIRQIAYFNTRLPDAQLQSLTAPSAVTTLSLDFTSGSYTVGY